METENIRKRVYPFLHLMFYDYFAVKIFAIRNYAEFRHLAIGLAGWNLSYSQYGCD
jgi:hypothetical protein